MLELNAAGARQDRAQYDSITTRIKEYTNKATLLESSEMLTPDSNGYQGWALALSVNAAANVGDNDAYTEMAIAMDAAKYADSETPDGKTLADLISRLASENRALLSSEDDSSSVLLEATQ